MNKLFTFFSQLKNVIAFSQLPKEDRLLTFYSEGLNYWAYLGGLVQTILDTSDITVCYLTASPQDPALEVDHPRLKTFIIGESFIRDWMFANIDTKVIVMTMPDLHQYQVKRSVNDVHYVYVQHSLVSLHMVYRPGAFDHYDTIFCAGPHHIDEIRALEAAANLPAKHLFKHGYARLDALKAESSEPSKLKKTRDLTSKHYLLAPSWGENGTIESGLGEKIVDLLLANGQIVTLRPHPQTLKFARDKIDAITHKYKDHANFTSETNVRGQASLQASDIMISDWSGAALDYAFGLGKPVLFLDVDRKVNNPDYKNIPFKPFEVTIRDHIGRIIEPGQIETLLDSDDPQCPPKLAENYVFNIGNSDQIGAAEIIRLVQDISIKET